MSPNALPTSQGLLRRLIVLNSVLALPAVVIAVVSLLTMLRLTAEQWQFFLMLTAGYTVVATGATILLQRWAMRSVAVWLDARAAGSATDEIRGAALGGYMALSMRSGLIGALNWAVPVVLVSIGMDVRFESWSFREYWVLIGAGACAAVTLGVFLGFVVKVRCSDVRDALAAEIPDPAERRRWIRPLPLRAKLIYSLTCVALVPVTYAAMLSVSRGDDSYVEFATSWDTKVLDSLPDHADAQAVDGLRAAMQQAVLPGDLELAYLEDLEDSLAPELLTEVRRQVAKGATRGDSRRILSPVAFAWRQLADGRTLVAASPSGSFGVSGGDALVFGVLIFASAGFALVVAMLLANDVSGAANHLRSEAERMAGGDLRRGLAFESDDEMGELARSFDAMSASLRATVRRVAEAADRVEARAGDLAPVSESVASVTADQVAGIERATSSMEEINAQVRGIAGSSQALNESVEESSSSILELGASGEELNETASLLGSKVEEVSSSIEQMVRSVKQVSENTESLSEAAIETSASMEEMASSLREVDVSADETAQLSAQVVSRAEVGQAKVRQTIDGMEAIREATETAERVIRNLHGRTEEIGAIVDVIDDVADETNLLALNAAIIAAQAGEHGRAFSVVADEIKDLAERVLASTKEIGTLIGSVQDEASNAIGAIERGSASVASGVDLSAEAGMALEEITAASRDSGERIQRIVSALREQAKGAGHVVELMERVRNGVDEIRSASAEQDRGNVVVYQGSVTMREVALQVRGTTEEQARGSGRIRESVEGVREAVEQINAALQEQSQACASAVEFLEAVRGRTRANEESATTMDSVTKDLLRQAEGLRDEVRRFRIE